MIAFLARAILIYCFFIFLKNVIKGMKETRPKRKSPKDDAIEAKFRRMD
jgi:hypothetical protein